MKLSEVINYKVGDPILYKGRVANIIYTRFENEPFIAVDRDGNSKTFYRKALVMQMSFYKDRNISFVSQYPFPDKLELDEFDYASKSLFE